MFVMSCRTNLAGYISGLYVCVSYVNMFGFVEMNLSDMQVCCLCVNVGWYVFRGVCDVVFYQYDVTSSFLVASVLSASCVVVKLDCFLSFLEFRFLYCGNVYFVG